MVNSELEMLKQEIDALREQIYAYMEYPEIFRDELLESSSKIQAELLELSFKKGWYQLETAEETKIEKAYDKFSNCLNELSCEEENSSN